MENHHELVGLAQGRKAGFVGFISLTPLFSTFQTLFILVSRLQPYCTGHSSGMGLSEFSNGNDAWSE
jgi:hypothetical protein